MALRPVLGRIDEDIASFQLVSSGIRLNSHSFPASRVNKGTTIKSPSFLRCALDILLNPLKMLF